MAAIGNFSFLGNSTVASAVEAEALNSLLIVLLSIIIAKAVIVVIQKYLKGVAKRTKTDIDDFMLDVITKPLYLGIIAAGIYLGLKPLSARLAYGLWLDRAFMVAYIFIAAFLVSRILGFAITRSLHVQKKYEKTPKLINKLIYVAVYLVAALVIIGSFNVEVTPILATLGLGSLAIGLALKDTLGNFFAGMHIISDKPISVGDYIEVEGVGGNARGYVEDIGWRTTRIRTRTNNIVVVPNAKLAESTILNYSLPHKESRVRIELGVGYASDLRKVERVTLEVARGVQKGVRWAVKDFDPVFRYLSFGDSNINFYVELAVQRFDERGLVMHEFIKALKERFDREGIEISWPVRKIYYGGEQGRKAKR